MVLLAPGWRVAAVAPGAVGLEASPNPYRLPEHETFDVILLCAEWCKWLDATAPDRVPAVLGQLRTRTRVLAAIDGHDAFSLALPARWFDRVDFVIKGQGLFHDRALYNYRVGPRFGPRSTTEQPPPRAEHWSSEQLDKLRLGPPCFLHVHPGFRAAVRRIKPHFGRREAVLRSLADQSAEALFGAERRLLRPTEDMFFVGTLTSRQRLDLLVVMDQLGISGEHRVTSVPPFVAGTAIEEVGGSAHLDLEETSTRIAPPSRTHDRAIPYYSNMDGVPLRSPPAQRADILSEIVRRGIATGGVSRVAFRRSMLRHRAIVAPPGYGEFTFRHGEALMSGRVLVCPDLGEVRTMFPFRDGENVRFCRPDFADIGTIARDLRTDTAQCDRWGAAGRLAWQRWTAAWPDLLDAGLVDHARAQLALRTATPSDVRVARPGSAVGVRGQSAP